MAEDLDIQQRIHDLIEEEHHLRESLAQGEMSPAEEHERLGRVEVELDRCWDLLRQRRARREFGQDPGSAEARPASTVEGYLE